MPALRVQIAQVPFTRISGVYVRRYRMKECALEVFTRHASYLFALGGRSSMRAVVAELNARLPAGISVTARGDPEALRKLVAESGRRPSGVAS